MRFRDKGAKSSAKAVLECNDSELSWFKFGALYSAHIPAVCIAKMVQGEIGDDRIIYYLNEYVDRIASGDRELIAHDFLEFPLYNSTLVNFNWATFAKDFGHLIKND